MAQNQITLSVEGEVLHRTRKSFPDKMKGGVVEYDEVVVIIPSLSQSALVANCKEVLTRGKFKATVLISSKNNELKLSLRDVQQPSNGGKAG